VDNLAQHIESLIFTASRPLNREQILECLEEAFETTIPVEDFESSLNGLIEKYQDPSFAFEIIEIAEGFQFLTKGAFHHTIGTFLKQTTRKQLSRSALETLAIVAYKQPVTKTELEKIRGVSCDYAMNKLLEKELVVIVGRSEAPGRPLLYSTSDKFMDYFGLKSLKDLPKPKEFTLPEGSIGEAAPIEESHLVEKKEVSASDSEVPHEGGEPPREIGDEVPLPPEEGGQPRSAGRSGPGAAPQEEE